MRLMLVLTLLSLGCAQGTQALSTLHCRVVTLYRALLPSLTGLYTSTCRPSAQSA
jgi:hypothetical protein